MRSIVSAALVMAACFCASDALAQSRCKVMDPTGTPLNLRDAPSGNIIGTIANGQLVSIRNVIVDGRGKAWADIEGYSDGLALGWAYREFLACF
ncbi:MAG TPA: SH3 domain-containing protein [Roseiarcus sp.]|nr:SH3 domain-containing protein [Roseiarcus sp.]